MVNFSLDLVVVRLARKYRGIGLRPLILEPKLRQLVYALSYLIVLQPILRPFPVIVTKRSGVYPCLVFFFTLAKGVLSANRSFRIQPWDCRA